MDNEDIKYDVRLVKHQMRRRVLSQEELDQRLATLPDDAESGEATETRFVGHFENRSTED